MPPSQTVLMQNIQRSANAIGKINPDRLTTGVIGRDQAEALLLLCILCLADIASVSEQGTREQGLAASGKIMVTLSGSSEPQALTLAQCQTWCSEVKTRITECVYRYRIQQALLQANVWVSDLRQPGSLSADQAIFAAETGCILLQTLQDALASGVSESLSVELNDAQISLAQVRKLGLYVSAAGKQGGKG